MSGPDYAARAAEGAAFLDEHVPGWAHRISTEALDMASCWWCVLGQLGGDYRDAVDDFGIEFGQEVALGFTRQSGDGSSWLRLREAWDGEIRKRREPAQAPS